MCQTYFGWTVRLKFTDEKSDQYYFMEFLFNEKEYQFYPFRYECFDHKIGDTEKDIKIDAEDYDNQNCEIGERFPKYAWALSFGMIRTLLPGPFIFMTNS